MARALELYYAASGETLLGEKLSDPERVLSAVVAAIPIAGRIIRAGKTGAHVVVHIARRTNSDPATVLTTLKRLEALEDEKALAEFVQAVEGRAGRGTSGRKALSPPNAPTASSARAGQVTDDTERVFGELSEELNLPKPKSATSPSASGTARTPGQVKKEAEKAERARRKAELAGKKLGESKDILANPAVAKAARALLNLKVSDNEILRDLWNKSRRVVSVEDVARTKEKSSYAKYRARLAFSNQRRRFWELVATEESEAAQKAREIFREAGFVFDGAAGTAPTARGLPGKAGRLSIDHIGRVADDPLKALDADNLRFITEEENTFLEVLKAAERTHERTFGGTFH